LSEPHSSRHGFFIIATLFLSLGLLYGIWYSYSVFLVALIDHFGWSRSVTAGAMSVFILSHGLFGPFAGRLVEVFGPRRLMMTGSVVMAAGLLISSQVNQWWQLYLSFGVLSALGLAACGWVPSVILTEKWFPDKVGTALGFVTGGIGVGIFTIVPLSNMMIEHYDWRLAFQVLAALVVLLILPAALFILREPPVSEDSSARAQASTSSGVSKPVDAVIPAHDWTVATAVRSRSFRFAVLAFFVGGCLSQLLIMHQFAFMVDHGVAKTVGSILAGIIGATSIPGKMLWGALSDRVGREWVFTGGLICILLSLGALALVGSVPGLLMPFMFAFLVGIGYSVNAPIIPAVARDLFAGPRFPSIFGTLSLFSSMGGAMGSWLGGALYDWSGGYQVMLWVSASLALIAPVMLWIAAPRKPESPPAP
jgi:MFS family permease